MLLLLDWEGDEGDILCSVEIWLSYLVIWTSCLFTVEAGETSSKELKPSIWWGVGGEW